LVAALYTKRRIVWWSIAIAVWMLAVLVAASRVVLGVHWTSDVVGSLLLAVIGVAAAERFVEATHSFGHDPDPEDPAQPPFNRCAIFRQVE